MRKIAANYIFLPEFPLVKNGYVIVGNGGKVDVINTGGILKEIAGLEFYGGFIVPDFAITWLISLQQGQEFVPVLERCYTSRKEESYTLAIIEGADLRTLTWRKEVRVRKLIGY